MRKLIPLIPLFALSLWGCGNNGDSPVVGDRSVGTNAVAQQVGNIVCQECHLAAHTAYFSGLGKVAPATAAISADCEHCHGAGQFHVQGGSEPGPMPYPQALQGRKVLASKHNAESADNIDMVAGGHDEGKCQRCHTAEGAVAFAAVVGAKPVYDNILNYGLTPAPGQVVALANLRDMSRVGDDAYEAVLDNHTLHNPTCSTCHDPLSREVVAVPGWDPNGNGKPDQFDLCTSCHLYQLADGTLVNSGLPLSDGTATAPFYHDTAWYRNITATHFDNPATGPQTDGNGDGIPESNILIEGYVLRKAGATPCFDCHGHELITKTGNLTRSGDGYVQAEVEPTIHTDWAKSAHAGALLTVKYAAQANGNKSSIDGTLKRDAYLTQIVTNAGTDDTTDPGKAWTHYNWDDNATRGACQHCHTATGAANFLDAAATGSAYDAANNDYSHLSGWAAAGGSSQNELLYCWGCHSSVDTGALRATGAVKLDYPVNGTAKSLVAPDGKSAACLSCHSGRGNAEKITGQNTPANPGGTAPVFTSGGPGTQSHYLAAALTINQAAVNAGYTFGRSYTDKSYFGHAKLGCAECHMTSENSHSFAVVAKDETTGSITRILSTKCVECHDGEHALFVADSQVGTVASIWDGTAAVPTTITQAMVDAAAAELEHEAHGFHQALEALGAVLAAAGTPPQAGYPYFSGTPANQGHSGAMYNYSYLHHEPGAYAHNRYLAKRLIWDSIDWMDDGLLNNSVNIAATYPAAAAWLGATRP